jgi:hypothetical protein
MKARVDAAAAAALVKKEAKVETPVVVKKESIDSEKIQSKKDKK